MESAIHSVAQQTAFPVKSTDMLQPVLTDFFAAGEAWQPLCRCCIPGYTVLGQPGGHQQDNHSPYTMLTACQPAGVRCGLGRPSEAQRLAGSTGQQPDSRGARAVQPSKQPGCPAAGL